MIYDHFESWQRRSPGRAKGDWLFAPDSTRTTYMTAEALSHKFQRLGVAAGVSRPALHRLRHGVAAYLVDQGKLFKAQARLGHRDPTTTLRHYSHAVALDDEDVADDLDRVLNDESRSSNRPPPVNKLVARPTRPSYTNNLQSGREDL